VEKSTIQVFTTQLFFSCTVTQYSLYQTLLLGYNISRSALYLRLLPRNCATTEGKRHTKTVPVKLLRARNTERKQHEDTHFAAATIKFLKDVCVLLGKQSVCVISQDDKAKVHLGLPAAKKQGPILMKVDYMIKLPDHDFVVASRHKLIPSVYAALEIKKDHVSYSGPTYIAIRSGKHDSSTAPRHAEDLDRLLGVKEFAEFIKTSSVDDSESSLEQDSIPGAQNNLLPTPTLVKPILVLFVDGGPDESPRFPKTLQFAAKNFRRFNLDALFMATYAPGQSASNPVERRMAPLSRDLSGLILPHESFGTHLNKSGKTVNQELEIKNFQRAGELLSEVWSQRVIDGFPVVCEYVIPGSNTRVSQLPVDMEGSSSESTSICGTESPQFSPMCLFTKSSLTS